MDRDGWMGMDAGDNEMWIGSDERMEGMETFIMRKIEGEGERWRGG